MKNKVKNFSTITLLLALCSSGWLSAANAQDARCAFLADAPDQHIVAKGDTLWAISQKFLEHAWCWPQVWGMNRQEIKNPHWIYPDQIVYFDRAAGRLRLGKALASDNLPSVRLSPQIRRDNLIGNAIPTIPANAIEPFLSQPVVFETDEFVNAPHIVAANRSHIISSNVDKVYVAGDLNGQTEFQVYRPSTTLMDPVTKQLLGFEYAYVGSVKLIKTSNKPEAKVDAELKDTANIAHTFTVTKSKEELAAGDRLLPVPVANMTNYAPHPPADKIAGRIVSIYGGVAMAGQNQTVSINLGAKDGIDIGTVLALSRSSKSIVDKADHNKLVQLPDEEYGSLFIYRVFNNVSYGLIMAVNDTTRIGDTVKTPE